MCLMMKKQILDSESDIPTTSSHEQLWHCSLIFTSDLETITEEKVVNQIVLTTK